MCVPIKIRKPYVIQATALLVMTVILHNGGYSRGFALLILLTGFYSAPVEIMEIPQITRLDVALTPISFSPTQKP